VVPIVVAVTAVAIVAAGLLSGAADSQTLGFAIFRVAKRTRTRKIG